MRYLVMNQRPSTYKGQDEMMRHDQSEYDKYRYDDQSREYNRSRYSEPRYDRHALYDEDRYEDYDNYYRNSYEDRGRSWYNNEPYDTVQPHEHYRSRSASFVLPNEDTANFIMKAGAFGEYIARHGYHFSNALADCATKMMRNTNRKEHRWTSDQIRQQLAMHGITDLGSCTLGDITYLANMAYADFFPDVINGEHACIKYAIAVAKDPDGYEGIAFSRWIADLIGKRITTIDWEKFV